MAQIEEQLRINEGQLDLCNSYKKSVSVMCLIAIW